MPRRELLDYVVQERLYGLLHNGPLLVRLDRDPVNEVFLGRRRHGERWSPDLSCADREVSSLPRATGFDGAPSMATSREVVKDNSDRHKDLSTQSNGGGIAVESGSTCLIYRSMRKANRPW